MLRKISVSLLSIFLLTSCSTGNDENKFIVGLECNYAPFNWLQSEEDELAVHVPSANGYCKGYDVTVAKNLATALNKELEIKAIAWEGLIPALQSDSIDAIIAGMSYTKDRAKEVDFTDAYYESDYVMLVSKGSKYETATSLSDFSGANVVGQMGTNYDVIIDQIEGVNHQPALTSYPLIVNAIKAGTADGAPAEKPTAEAILSTNPELVMIEFEQGQGFTQNEDVTTAVSIAVRKGDTELLNALNKALAQINQSTRAAWMQEAISADQGE